MGDLGETVGIDMKKFVALLMIIGLLLPGLAIADEEQIFESGDFEYTVEGDTSRISKYTGEEVRPVLPSEFEGKPVTVIGHGAFLYHDTMVEIVLPNGVVTIEENAFLNCVSLSSLTLPEGLESIGDRAFFYDAGLREVALPESMTAIGDHAFSGCTNLTQITIPKNVLSIGAGVFSESGMANISVDEANSIFCEIDGVLFTKQDNVLHTYPAGREGDKYEVPDGTKVIGASAFDSVTNLTEVIIPDSVISIEAGAFAYCENLTAIDMPEGIDIADDAFEGCEALDRR